MPDFGCFLKLVMMMRNEFVDNDGELHTSDGCVCVFLHLHFLLNFISAY